MLRADKVIAAGAWTGEPADSVVLEFDERYRRRFVMTGVGGLAFLLDLPEAAMLRGGDGLRLEDGRIVEVLAAPEPLAEIRAADALALMRVAWHLGNRHLPTELTPKALAHPPRSVIEDMAKGLGARVMPVEAPFNPEGGAYVQAEPSRTRMRPSMLITATTPMRAPTITPITATIIPITAMIMITSIAIIPTIVTGMITIMRTTATIMDMGPAEPDRALLPLMLWLSPAFPVGSFAYSHGLEWAVEAGDIFDARSLGGWLVDLLTFGAPRADAILFAAAFRAAEVRRLAGAPGDERARRRARGLGRAAARDDGARLGLRRRRARRVGLRALARNCRRGPRRLSGRRRRRGGRARSAA